MGRVIVNIFLVGLLSGSVVNSAGTRAPETASSIQESPHRPLAELGFDNGVGVTFQTHKETGEISFVQRGPAGKSTPLVHDDDTSMLEFYLSITHDGVHVPVELMRYEEGNGANRKLANATTSRTITHSPVQYQNLSFRAAVKHGGVVGGIFKGSTVTCTSEVSPKSWSEGPAAFPSYQQRIRQSNSKTRYSISFLVACNGNTNFVAADHRLLRWKNGKWQLVVWSDVWSGYWHYIKNSNVFQIKRYHRAIFTPYGALATFKWSGRFYS